LTSNVIYKAFKFRLYPTREQEVFFEKSAGCTRFIYNKLLEMSMAEYARTGKFILGWDLSTQIPGLKKEFPWLKEVYARNLVQSANDLAKAFKNRFSKKYKKNTGFPKFKKRGNRDSFRFDFGFTIKPNQIKLPKIGWVAARTHRKLEGKVKNITISKDVDIWYVSVLCELPEKVSYYDPNNAIGIDLGIKTFAVTSDGECIDPPKQLGKEIKKLKRLQRRHSKKQKGSKNRNKARLKVARQHRKIRRINKNFVETESAVIAKLYDVVSVETLNIQGMKANNKLAPSIQKLNWGGFVSALQRKVPITHKVSQWFPSSKTCSCCGWVKKDLTLGDRIFSCGSCGFELDRDANAAMNLLNEWKRTATSAGIACGEDVRPEGGFATERQTSVKQEYKNIGSYLGKNA
jgi:putative transposase